ncbi:prolyl oligopeptidase family serine peptidase [Undibacterium amnicola]|uniref:Prolyl oligopeptidase family serine peptidase n=1 Tax=Undibacterium amnicola TaxID=1834038 RepID=A0ABR6XTQ7_9BURK|nr:PHB depolymerase family esterase [Undibacterium amnicola]MBC3832858.1 prolyl oligopeptidase family serine peptidase [Undibacterium amnicola]
MKKILLRSLFTLLGLVALAAGLFAYFLYTPDPDMPQLSGVLTKATIEIDGKERTYRTYLPKDLTKGAPLIIVMHGSGQNGSQIRLETGYGFDRLADQYGFGVVYPSAGSFDWNDCSKVGDFKVDGHELDHVKFVTLLTDKLIKENGFDPQRVFATGVSSGGFMSLRLAIEAPARFRSVAAVSANLPVADNFKCTITGQSTSVMIMNGTEDPIVHYEGGETSLLGLFYKGGILRSSQDTAKFFADLNKIDGDPVINPVTSSDLLNGEDKTKFERALWKNVSKTEVELVTIYGGGHGMPQPYWKRPRLVGPSPMAPNGPAIIWDFFARQNN